MGRSVIHVVFFLLWIGLSAVFLHRKEKSFFLASVIIAFNWLTTL